jgi:hypothetical protein
MQDRSDNNIPGEAPKQMAKEKRGFTPEEVKRFEEIRKIINEYNDAMSRNQRPAIPFISIDERIRCKQYFDFVDPQAADKL